MELLRALELRQGSRQFLTQFGLPDSGPVIKSGQDFIIGPIFYLPRNFVDLDSTPPIP